MLFPLTTADSSGSLGASSGAGVVRFFADAGEGGASTTAGTDTGFAVTPDGALALVALGESNMPANHIPPTTTSIAQKIEPPLMGRFQTLNGGVARLSARLNSNSGCGASAGSAARGL